MADEHVYKFSSHYLQKWLRYNMEHVKKKTGTFHLISGIYRDFQIFLPILTLQKVS